MGRTKHSRGALPSAACMPCFACRRGGMPAHLSLSCMRPSTVRGRPHCGPHREFARCAALCCMRAMLRLLHRGPCQHSCGSLGLPVLSTSAHRVCFLIAPSLLHHSRLQVVRWLSCCCMHWPCKAGCGRLTCLRHWQVSAVWGFCEGQSSLRALQTVCKGPLPAACCLPQLLNASYRLCMAACETAEQLPMRMVSNHCHPSCCCGRWLSLSLLGLCKAA